MGILPMNHGLEARATLIYLGALRAAQNEANRL